MRFSATSSAIAACFARYVVPKLPLPSTSRSWYAGAATMVAGAPCQTKPGQIGRTIMKGIPSIKIDCHSSDLQWRGQLSASVPCSAVPVWVGHASSTLARKSLRSKRWRVEAETVGSLVVPSTSYSVLSSTVRWSGTRTRAASSSARLSSLEGILGRQRLATRSASQRTGLTSANKQRNKQTNKQSNNQTSPTQPMHLQAV